MKPDTISRNMQKQGFCQREKRKKNMKDCQENQQREKSDVRNNRLSSTDVRSAKRKRKRNGARGSRRWLSHVFSCCGWQVFGTARRARRRLCVAADFE